MTIIAIKIWQVNLVKMVFTGLFSKMGKFTFARLSHNPDAPSAHGPEALQKPPQTARLILDELGSGTGYKENYSNPQSLRTTRILWLKYSKHSQFVHPLCFHA